MSRDSGTAPNIALSQSERLGDALVAPAKTFIDVLRSNTWWLPFLVVVLCSYALTAAIAQKVGWEQLVQNEIQANPSLSERLATLPPAQLQRQQHMMQVSFQSGFYAGPLFTLAYIGATALVLWGTINFVFGGSATFGRTFCMSMYAALPLAVASLLAAIMLYVGRSPESFTRETMLGSNPGYYINAAGPLKTLLTSLDVFTLWNAILLGIGLGIVGQVKRSSGLLAVFGWFVTIVLFRTAIAAVRS